MHHRRSLPVRILLWGVAGLATLFIALALFIAVFDWNMAKPWITRQFSAALNRRIEVTGDLQLSWTQGPPTESSATRFIPRLRLRAHDIEIGNPTWATASPYLARAAFVDMSFSAWPLVHRHWRITDLELRQADIVMERGADRQKNWRFTQRPRSLWSFDIRRLAFDRTQIRYVDRIIDLDLRADATPASNAPESVLKNDVPDFAVRFGLSGSFREAPIKGRGEGGALLDLLNDGAQYPARAEGEIGKVHAKLDGMFFNPHHLTRADIKLDLAGDTLADLYAATGIPLPNTRAFDTRGDLVITRESEEAKVWDWRYNRFTGHVGESDFSGDAQFVKGGEVPVLRVNAQSNLVRLSDLVPSLDDNKKTPAKSKDKNGKVLPAQQFHPERWRKLDADVKFSGKKIVHSPTLTARDASTEIKLKSGVLTAAPLSFGLGGGRMDGSLSIDARQDEAQAQLRLAARRLQVNKLFPKLGSVQASFGEVDGEGELRGTGNSVSAMLASADGQMNAIVSEGSVSKFILEAAGLNVADAVFAKFYNDKQVRLNCALADFKVERGRADIRRFMVDTEDAVIDVTGHIDLARETMDVDIKPNSKGVRVFSLRSPLYARGSFAHPDIGPYKGPLVARAGAAAALALVAPIAAVVPLVSLGKEERDECPAALAGRKK